MLREYDRLSREGRSISPPRDGQLALTLTRKGNRKQQLGAASDSKIYSHRPDPPA
jgi:hypothetical protein